jgi:trehalose synthase
MGKISLANYKKVVRPQNIEEIQLLAEKVGRQRVKMVNSTSTGGGVAEILARLVPLLNELGLNVKWDVIKGNSSFFGITKSFHNSLQGEECEITNEMLNMYVETSDENMREMDFSEDVVVIHDPQPLTLIKARDKYKNKWIWRCHIDLSKPQARLWNFLKDYIVKYDASIFSSPSFSQQLPMPQYLIQPTIDPLSEKNRELSKEEISRILKKHQIPQDKPIITQVSRFDIFKDPLGVIDTFRFVKKQIDCRLILAGGGADDDPEGSLVLEKVKEKAGNDPDIHILVLPSFSDLEINALQRASTIVLQKSLREGFGLTVTEALWKGKPVVATAVGGIPLQIIHNMTGILVHTKEGAAYQIKRLLTNPDLMKKLGNNAKTYVREKYLLPRLIRNYLLLIIAVQNPGKNIITL